MSNEVSQEETKKPATGQDPEELSETELDQASGGTVINPQPLPPRRMPD